MLNDKIIDRDAQSNVWVRSKHKLGSGGFSTLYKCVNNSQAAIKVCTNDNKSINMLVKEIEIYKQFNSDRVPKLLGWGDMFIVVERFTYDLSKFIMFKRPKKSTLKQLGSQVIDSLQYLHDMGLIHCDIKPVNILIQTNPMRAVLTDFGLARRLESSCKPIQCQFGTKTYMSVNIHDNVYPSRKSDLQSLGYVLYELLGGVLPWKNLSDIDDIGRHKQMFIPTSILSVYFQNLNNLSHADRPNYDVFKANL
jgi:serine/threonine protein kinase